MLWLTLRLSSGDPLYLYTDPHIIIPRGFSGRSARPESPRNSEIQRRYDAMPNLRRKWLGLYGESMES